MSGIYDSRGVTLLLYLNYREVVSEADYAEVSAVEDLSEVQAVVPAERVEEEAMAAGEAEAEDSMSVELHPPLFLLALALLLPSDRCLPFLPKY